MYRFEFKLNDLDYTDFHKFHLSNSPAVKKQIFALRLLLPVILVILTAILYKRITDFNFFIHRIISLVILSIVWILAIKPLFNFSLGIQIKLMKKDGKLPYGQDNLLIFDEDFYIEIADETESKRKYSKIEKINIRKNMVCVYISVAQAILIPFSAFESEQQRNEFLSFLKDKTNLEPIRLAQ